MIQLNWNVIQINGCIRDHITMKRNSIRLLALILYTASGYAQDIQGTWKVIDDKSGQPKGVVEIRKKADETYSGKILKLIPVYGFKVVEDTCINCPAPYTNQPMVGMEVLKGLKYNAEADSYEGGQIIDPKIGRIYSVKAKLQGKFLKVRGYLGTTLLGRNQIWIREK